MEFQVDSDRSPICPKLVVFDLDFTLWDCGGLWCDCTTPPFRIDDQGRVVDSWERHIRLYDDALPILRKLRKLEIPAALASRTDQPAWANELTALLDINHYFQYREICPGSKIRHLTKISNDSGIPLEAIAFFDDEHRNIIDTEQLGVNAVLVENGIRAEVFEAATGIEI